MDLISMLPLLKGWSYFPLDVDVPFIIAAGREEVMGEADKPGLFLSGMCALNDPDAELVIHSYDPYRGMVESNLEPRSLYTAGLTVPNATGIWTPRYDDVDKVYVVAYTPAVPLPFGPKYKLLIRAPATKSVMVLNYAHLLVEIFDREAFLEGLREVLGVPITIEAIIEAIKITLPRIVRSEKVEAPGRV